MNYDIEKMQRVINGDSGEEFKLWLVDKIEQVKYIDNIDTGFNLFRAGIDVKVAKKTYNKLREILQEIINFGNIRSTNDPRDKYY